MVKITSANSISSYKMIADLARSIWTEHYTPIIGEQQVTYMLNKFQSAQAIKEQIDQGGHYYLLNLNEKPVGYFSYVLNPKSLFLSKLYVLNSARGNGIGSQALAFIAAQVKKFDLSKIELTVNKYNTNSINVYEKMGFVNVNSIVQDIGNGYIMDDYVMEKYID